MERLMLGWLDCEEIDHDGTYTLEPLARNKGLILKTNNPDEYFLFENRSNASDVTLWDSYFEYGGLLVWHIDRSDNIVTWTDGSGTHTTTAMGMWGEQQPQRRTDTSLPRTDRGRQHQRSLAIPCGHVFPRQPLPDRIKLKDP